MELGSVGAEHVAYEFDNVGFKVEEILARLVRFNRKALRLRPIVIASERVQQETLLQEKARLNGYVKVERTHDESDNNEVAWAFHYLV